MTKIDPNVFVEAAELIANGKEEFACFALATLEGKSLLEANTCTSVQYLESIYQPKLNNPKGHAWLTENDDPDCKKFKITRRVLALLFAAEIARDGGL